MVHLANLVLYEREENKIVLLMVMGTSTERDGKIVEVKGTVSINRQK
jgi:hypothetical protein